MNYVNPTIGETLLISLVGFIVVFSVLIVLMGIIWLLGKSVGSIGNKKVAAPAVAAPAPAPAPAATVAPAGLLLENVSDKEAAMIMAIVSDDLNKDPAELNFISIKEVK